MSIETSATTTRGVWMSATRSASAVVTRRETQRDARGFPAWNYQLRIHNAETSLTFTSEGEDTINGPATADEALETLASFLGAWQEAVDYSTRVGHASENTDLFPVSCTPFLAYVNELVSDTYDGES